MRTDVMTACTAAVFLVCASSALRGTSVQELRPSAADPTLDALEQRLSSAPDSLEAGNAYRLAVIRARAHDRCLAFFDRLVTTHRGAPNAHLNFGFAYVDKIPSAGAITQVILANSALNQFTVALELRPNWVTYYTRGSSYLFWPAALGRAPLGVADLEHALALQRTETLRSYHVRAFITLGDGYWKTRQPERARALWEEGARVFPGNALLRTRLSSDADTLDSLIADAFDPNRRVDTDLRELWEQP